MFGRPLNRKDALAFLLSLNSNSDIEVYVKEVKRCALCEQPAEGRCHLCNALICETHSKCRALGWGPDLEFEYTCVKRHTNRE